jgi:AAA ATPase central domain protein
MANVINEMFIDIVNDALSGKKDSLLMRLRVMAKKLKKEVPDLAKELESLISTSNTTAVARGQPLTPQFSPVDVDTRQKLLIEAYPVVMDTVPIWSEKVNTQLNRFIAEWEMKESLHKSGLHPSTSLLISGPPGVGKTLSAKWIAHKLDIPLLTLDLASVMSSYLGKTGNNIKAVLNYASSFPCVLLLDEFDSIAKKRDDTTDVGELKRLVTVILQAIDEWPKQSVLIAATNHSELLDPAVWRRFDSIIDFELPNQALIKKYLISKDISNNLADYISTKLHDISYAIIERSINQAKKNSIIEKKPFSATLINELLGNNVLLENVIETMLSTNISQRKIAQDLGISRAQIQKFVKEQGLQQ